MKLLSTILVLGLSSASYAGSIKAPFSYNSTTVMPRNVRTLSFNGIASEVKNKYDNNGTIVGLGNDLNKQISWNDLLEGENDPVKRGEYEGYLLSKGVDLNEFTGQTTGLVNVAANISVPVIGMGVTRKFTLAVAIPVIEVESKIDVSAVSGQALERVATDLANDGKLDDATELKTKYMNAITDKLVENGYKPLANEKKQSLGDIKVVGKYLLSNKKNYAIAIMPELTLPTGEPADIDKLVDVPSGDGQTDVALGVVADFKMIKNFTFTVAAKYTVQMSDKQALRVREKEDTKLTPDIDQSVDRDLGDIFEASVGANYAVTDWANLVGAVNFGYKEADKFSGSKFEKRRYDWMSIDTEQSLTSFQVGADFHTLRLYQQGKFAAPLKTSLNYSGTLSGKNTGSDALYSLNLSLFF